MSMVQQTEDEMMIVRDNTGKVYIDTETNFATDFGETVPALPAGADDRTYEPGKRHAITDCFSIIEAGPLPWAAGDRYIANVQAGLDAQAARRAAIPPVHP
jgi:hypothetical protein